jgi:dTDP-4-dehydrorhamnose 3,5-epimerase-like enzyme
MLPDDLEVWDGTRGVISAGKPVLIPMARFIDHRGSLSVFDKIGEDFFSPKRIFFQHDISASSIRGEHAHLTCEQILFPLVGPCRVTLTSRHGAWQKDLNPFEFGLYIPVMTWSTQQYLENGSSVLVLASQDYDESDYIREYLEFEKTLDGE